jgi:hypothetical protein
MKTVQSSGLRRPAQDGTAGLPCAARLLPALAGLDEGAAALAMRSLRVMTAKERCAGVRTVPPKARPVVVFFQE